MRKKRNTQTEFDFQPSTLGVTNEYFARYEAMGKILEENPKILDRIHADLKKAQSQSEGEGGECEYTSETVLRVVICQIVERESVRGIVIRIDDSNYLRRFVRIYNGPMMDFTTYSRLRNAIQPKTWKKINEVLTAAVVEAELISGEKLRLDTTAVETNIHWPTDSGLLWDTYRVLSRLINTARELDP